MKRLPNNDILVDGKRINGNLFDEACRLVRTKETEGVGVTVTSRFVILRGECVIPIKTIRRFCKNR